MNRRTFLQLPAPAALDLPKYKDGLRGVWHGGPFSRNRRFRFYPKQMMFGTDLVAMDRPSLTAACW